MKEKQFLLYPALLVALIITPLFASAADKPNILVIWGDDIGQSNISYFTRGVMGYRTPNIDRIAEEGMAFTDYYGEQSCTAGRSSFITGQSVFRTGLSKVGLPGAEVGLKEEDPTIAAMLKAQGYATGQFGKNHLGDRNEYLPTVHGFDEYAGVLYHLNALEEPENVDYPKHPKSLATYGPRDSIHTWATDKDDKTVQPRWGKVGKQKIKDTGQVTIERMKTYDDETLKQSINFMDKAVKAGKPFFVWHNTTRTHYITHLRPKYADMIAEKGFYGAAMTEFDDTVGALMAELDKLGVADNTIVILTSDNAAMKFSWPDGGTTPFKQEKATTWEGGVRVPAIVRWPGVIAPDTWTTEIFAHNDWMPTLLAAAGEPGIKEKLLKGHKAGGKKYKVHLDGYDQTALLSGKGPSARKEFHYVTDNGDYAAFRYGKWKISFLTQECIGQDVWDCSYKPHGFPRITNLREDPFEAMTTKGISMGKEDWVFRRTYLLVPAQGIVAPFVKSFVDYPPRGLPASFSVGDALKMISKPQHN